MHTNKQRLRTLLFVAWACIIVGIILLVAATAQWGQPQQPPPLTQSEGPSQVANGAVTTPPSTEKPKPSEFDAYTVAPDLPRYLFIPKLSVKAMVKPVGLTQDNRIDAPKNAFDAGWYTGSSKPGQDGALFIDGHVSGGSVPGIFAHLKDLQPGDTLSLERGDGIQFNYKVLSKKEYDVNAVDMHTALSSASSRQGLNLITCTGAVMKGSNNYDKRLVVFTERF